MPKPTFHAYIVRDGKDKDANKKGYWTKVGAAFPHKDGKGFDLVLDALPIDGRLKLREPFPDEQA